MELNKFIEELKKAQYQIAINQRFSGDGSGMTEIEVISDFGEPEVSVDKQNRILIS